MSPFLKRVARWLSVVLLSVAALAAVTPSASADDATSGNSSTVQSDNGQSVAVQMQDSIWG